jgi:hypothetical protein
MTRTLLAVLAAAVAAFALVAGPASAADSHAPKGARLDWLPADEWVMSSWLPFDEARLTAILHTDRAGLDAWLDDHRSLAQLARRSGHRSARALARRLVAPRLAQVPRGMRPVLERRALDVLTQAHLSNHVIFHVFHTPAIAEHAETIFGVTPASFRRLRDGGISPKAIGAFGGRTSAAVRARLATMLRARGQRAVRVGAMSAAQADALYAHQAADLNAFVTRAYRTPAQQLSFLCRAH